MMDYAMIFIVGVILGMVIMAIIAAAGNIQWGCRNDTKSEEQEILDQLKASELGICSPVEYAYNSGYKAAKAKYERPQGGK